MVLADDKQLLARCSIVARGDIVHAAIADIEPLHDNPGEEVQSFELRGRTRD
jgi:hypothetical protein